MALVLKPEYIAPLQKAHDRKSFDCGSEDLNRYLREQARQDAEKRVAAPFFMPSDCWMYYIYLLRYGAFISPLFQSFFHTHG